MILRRLLHSSRGILTAHNAQSFKKHRELSMPDLSSPKWERRSKLSAMNFANKNKSGHKLKRSITSSDQLDLEDGQRGGPTPSRREQEEIRRQRPKELLPKAKITMASSLSADEMDNVYRAINESPSVDLRRPKLPGQIDPEAVDKIPPFLDSKRIEYLESSARKELKQKLITSGLPENLLPDIDSAADASEKGTSHTVESNSPGSGLESAEVSGAGVMSTVIDHELLSQIIYLNAKTARPEQAEQTLQIMTSHQILPSLNDYNQLMDAYANAGDLPGALGVFQRIHSDPVLDADVKTFGIIIKCLARNRRLNDAFKLYEQMKSMQIQPSQPIYTTLLKACSQSGDFNRAWRLFEHMRNEVCRPDEITMNHMIHICAKTNNVEKAMLLYQDFMNNPSPDGGKLIPLESTFNSLIHACARRPEYYAKTFNLVKQMEAIGLKADRITYNYMLMACKTQGDVWRAKALWSDMMTTAVESGRPELLPDEQSYTQMLSCFSRAPNLLLTVWRKTFWEQKMNEFHRQLASAKMGLDNEDRMEKGLRPIDINEWMIDDKFDPDAPLLTQRPNEQLEELRKYVLDGKSETERFTELKADALGFFEMYKSKAGSLPSGDAQVQKSFNDNGIGHEKPLSLTVHALNAYIATLGAFRLRQQALEEFQKFSSSYKIERNSQTYLSMIRYWFDPAYAFMPTEKGGDDPKFILENGWNIYEEYERHRRLQGLPERWDELEQKYVRNKWQQKGITHTDRRLEYEIYKYTIRGLARHNDLVRATRLLAILIERGHARVTDIMHRQPDMYSPLFSSATDSGNVVLNNFKFAIHPESITGESAEVDQTLFDSAAAPDKDSSVLLQSITSPHLNYNAGGSKEISRNMNPRYAPAAAQFRPSDFRTVLDQARNNGDSRMIERVEQLLYSGRRSIERKNESVNAQMDTVKNRLRKRWHQ